MNRRFFIAGGISSLMPNLSSAKSPDFSFVHFTDVHIEDELNAAIYTRRCFEQINRHKPAFSISGGDLVFDANAVTSEKAKHLFDLYAETARVLNMPVHHAIGNHDVYATQPRLGQSTREQMFGKRMFEARIGKTYYSFDHKGWHFVILDSITLDSEGNYLGWIGDEQLQWLEADLRRAGTQTPTVVATHIPLATGFLQYGDLAASMPYDQLVIQNSRKVCDLFSNYSVKAVLQGHLHACESLVYRGTQYLTTGAVCGDWWRGPRLGFAEGYTLLNVQGDRLEAKYVLYDKNRPS